MLRELEGTTLLTLKKATNNWKYVHPENLKYMKMTEKKFDAVKFMREQRQNLTNKLSKMTKQEIVEYFKKQRISSTVKPSA